MLWICKSTPRFQVRASVELANPYLFIHLSLTEVLILSEPPSPALSKSFRVDFSYSWVDYIAVPIVNQYTHIPWATVIRSGHGLTAYLNLFRTLLWNLSGNPARGFYSFLLDVYYGWRRRKLHFDTFITGTEKICRTRLVHRREQTD